MTSGVLKRLLLFVPCFAVLTCNGSDNSSTTVKQTVGPSGGALHLNDASGGRLLDLDIPSGALSGTVKISAAPSADAPPATTGSGAAATLVGSVFELGPDGTVFAEPVRVSFHYDASALGDIDPSELRAATIVGDTWQVLGSPEADAGASIVSGTTLHFSRFGVVAIGCASSADCNDHNPCTNDTCNGSGRCVVAPASGACDDGNACTTGDSCQSGTCVSGSPVPACTAVCGNGNLEGDEACDDGNGIAGDGCTSCTIDSGWSCAGSPSVCTPPVTGTDADSDGYNTSNDCVDSWSTFCSTYAGMWVCSITDQRCNPQNCSVINNQQTCAATPGCYFLQICHNTPCPGGETCSPLYTTCPADGSPPPSPRVGYRPEDIHPGATDVCHDGVDNSCSGSGDACPTN